MDKLTVNRALKDIQEVCRRHGIALVGTDRHNYRLTGISIVDASDPGPGWRALIQDFESVADDSIYWSDTYKTFNTMMIKGE